MEIIKKLEGFIKDKNEKELKTAENANNIFRSKILIKIVVV